MLIYVIYLMMKTGSLRQFSSGRFLMLVYIDVRKISIIKLILICVIHDEEIWSSLIHSDG